MKIIKSSYFIVLLILLLTVSCVKQNAVDFSRIKLTFSQQIKTGFINFTIDSNFVKEVNSLQKGTQVSFETPFDVFNNTAFQQHLDLIKIHFEIENTYDRKFEVKTDFLDANGIKYSIKLNAPKKTKTLIDKIVSNTNISKCIRIL